MQAESNSALSVPTSLNGLTFSVRTFGCQMNKHDSERIVALLEALGAESVSTIEEADVVVFMTCCVREAADVRLYGQVASMKNIALREKSPLGRRIVAVGGCIGQRDGSSLLKALGNVDIVFGTHNISSLPEMLCTVVDSGERIAEVLEGSAGFEHASPLVREHAWAAWLPISIGCDNFCTYCVVPSVRGRETSLPFEEIVKTAARYVADGVKEITLLGQNVNSYGRDRYGSPRFADVLDAVDATGIARLRFATSHPKDLSDEVIKRFATLRSLQPALHLPVQSGSDRILALMGRGYTAQHYRDLVAALREVNPDIALSSDVIVGFPGETEEDFEETARLVEQVGFNQVFTFIYSKRAGTPAAAMEDDTPSEVVQERFERLVDIVQRSAYACNQRDVGSVVEVLVEGASKRDPSMLAGKSPKNQTVHAPVPDGVDPDDLSGTFVNVSISEAKTWYLLGEVVS